MSKIDQLLKKHREKLFERIRISDLSLIKEENDAFSRILSGDLESFIRKAYLAGAQDHAAATVVKIECDYNPNCCNPENDHSHKALDEIQAKSEEFFKKAE